MFGNGKKSNQNTKHYSKKPLSTKELAEKAKFTREDSYNQYRKDPELRPEHAKRNNSGGKRW